MPTHPDLAVETAGLEKRFGSVRAVDGVDLAVPTGSVYAVLGPNGAGKTTTIRVLATLLPADGGTARVLGHDVQRDPAAVRRRVALTGQFASVDEDLTGRDNLLLQGRLLGYSRAQARTRTSDLLDEFGLADAANRKAQTYSGGMRRRLDIAASIMVTPELIFLDEPTTGLDPRSRNQVWETVRSAVAAGSTVLLTTQYLDEADHLADRVAVVDHGTVIAEGTTGELKASVGSGALRVRLRDAGERERAERLLAEVLDQPVHLDSDPASLSVGVTDAARVPAALGCLTASDIEVTEFALGQPSLDEVFLALTGRTAGTEHEETKEAAA